jgi:hypothetical protein
MLKSATGRIRRGEPGTASQDSAAAKWRALKARFTFGAGADLSSGGHDIDFDDLYVWN